MLIQIHVNLKWSSSLPRPKTPMGIFLPALLLLKSSSVQVVLHSSYFFMCSDKFRFKNLSFWFWLLTLLDIVRVKEEYLSIIGYPQKLCIKSCPLERFFLEIAPLEGIFFEGIFLLERRFLKKNAHLEEIFTLSKSS